MKAFWRTPLIKLNIIHLQKHHKNVPFQEARGQLLVRKRAGFTRQKGRFDKMVFDWPETQRFIFGRPHWDELLEIVKI
ncbi:MAG: hypothetical protein PUK16_04820 [Prevotellaceae bacterium]|nr:hypothetical protein [Prevotellaceae bacterium]